MKFKLFEDYDYALDDLRSLVQEYIYDAIDELGNASLDKYITWYIEEFKGHDIDIDLLEKVVTDKYIEAVDTGKIKADKTKLTSELKQYIASNKHLINDTDELMNHCPEHLQHELKLVIDIANLNESLLEELPSKFKQKLYDFIKQNHNLLDTNIDELYLLCPVGLKRDLADLLKSANIDVNTELVNKFEFLVGTYTLQDLDRIVIDHEGQPGTTTDNVGYIIRNWNKFDFPEYDSLTEAVLEEAVRPDLKRFIKEYAELIDENNIEELYKQCPRELKIPLVRMLNAASLGNNVETIKRATFLADFYDDDELINLVLSIGEHANDVFDAFDYIMNNWDEFFTDDMLNEELLTERTSRKQIDKILTFIKQQMSLNNTDCISSADIRKVATHNPQANFINQKTSQELMRIINDSDSGLEATMIDSNTNTFMICQI